MNKRDAMNEALKLYQQTSSSVPVDLSAIASSLKVQIMYPDLEDSVSGMLVFQYGQAVIGVNANHAQTRQRFTIAHEIGHYCLHGEAGTIFVDERKIQFRNEQSSSGTSLQEIHANAFAAALLMPEQEIHSRAKLMVENQVEAEIAIWQLAVIFEVSEEAMKRRLVDLGYDIE